MNVKPEDKIESRAKQNAGNSFSIGGQNCALDDTILICHYCTQYYQTNAINLIAILNFMMPKRSDKTEITFKRFA